MTSAMTRSSTRRLIPIAAAAALPLAFLPGAVANAAAGHHGPGGPGGGWGGGHGTSQACPAPQALVAGTTFVKHDLAPGVTLSEGTAHDKTVWGQAGTVDMHVLRITMADTNVRFAPLVRHYAQRNTLSSMAAGNSHLVAATNTGFFDFDRDAPLGPVLVAGEPSSLGAKPSSVIGFTAGHQIEEGKISLEGEVKAAGHAEPIAGLNYLPTKRGLSVYTSAWGSTDVPFAPSWRNSDLGAVVRNGVIVQKAGSIATPPSSGELLVASTPSTRTWLKRLSVGTKVAQAARVVTTTPKPLVQAYSVGSQLVSRPGKVETNLGCDERDTQAARTAVGYTKGGKQMIIVVVADHPGTTMHGLDHKEMSKVMVDLGAAKAWQWDGSGSSEMIARIGNTLSIRNYCADGQERPMPVGFGIYNYPVKKTTHHKH